MLEIPKSTADLMFSAIDNMIKEEIDKLERKYRSTNTLKMIDTNYLVGLNIPDKSKLTGAPRRVINQENMLENQIITKLRSGSQPNPIKMNPV